MGRQLRDGGLAARGGVLKIAVTGGTGFIGQHVVAALQRRSVSPVVACLPGAPVPPAVAGCPIVTFDLKDPPPDAFDLMGRPDVVIHLAWGELGNFRSPSHYEVELPAQYAFLKGLVRSGATSFVIAGTCLEYGMQSGPLHEGLESRPVLAYPFAKDTLRRQLEFLRLETPFSLTWARLFYLYGDGQTTRNSLFLQLRAAMEQGRSEFSMSGGEQLRDYLPIGRAGAYLAALALINRDNGIVNVCSGTPISVRRLVERWIEQNGAPMTLDLGRYPYPDYEPMAFWGDARKLHGLVPEEFVAALTPASSDPRT